jgi:2-amino-4-hydroxy-6-hydroxymethyldihydropteridine diphosphokinase
MPVLRSKEKNSKVTVYIGLGTNSGEREKNIERSLQRLKGSPEIDLFSVSPLYDTEPYGEKEQPRFLNGVVKIETTLSPKELLGELKKIEREMGRKKRTRWAPRVIDLDILFYDGIVYKDEEVEIPHPDLHNRWFVLKPMNDLAPTLVHPIIKKTVRQLLEGLNG